VTPNHHIHVFVNHSRIGFQEREQTGRSIKERACVPLEHVLGFDPHKQHVHEGCGCERQHRYDELKIIADDQKVLLDNGQHFWSLAPATQGVTVSINKKDYEFADPHQTGRSLKERAGIPASDVLFLDRPHEDEVIADDTKVVLKCGESFHSSPPANYGALAVSDVGFSNFESLPQPDGWTFVVVHDYSLPTGLSHALVNLLVKLPPTFPDGAPDMFWLSPEIRTASGVAPQGTSSEMLLGTVWQRFSWHLNPGAWRPGVSTLRDFMRCVRARLEKRN
jgi:Prokaryotic E2 family E